MSTEDLATANARSAAPYLLYTAAAPNGFKVSIMLEELGVAYETRTLDLEKGEQKDPPYQRKRPAAARLKNSSWCAAGRISPHISTTLPLAEVASAMRVLQDRAAAGKILLSLQLP